VFHGYSHNVVFDVLTKFLGQNVINNRGQQLKQSQAQPKKQIESLANINEYYQKNITEVDYEVPSYVDQLKQGDVSLNSILGISSMYYIQRLLNPDSLLERHYICLDSKYRVGADSNTYTTQTWNYAATTNQRDGFITSQNEIRNIKAIRMYQTRIPWDTDASTFPVMRCVSVLFHEFASQSIITYTQRRFHFLMQMIWNSSTVTGMELSFESNNDSVYEFQKPFLTFDKLTYSFASPYTLMTIYHDRDTCTFTYSAFYTSVVCSKAHLFNNPTWITITGFTTGSPTTQSVIIDAINSADGQYVTVTNSTTLRLAAYFPSASITPVVGLTANVYFDRRRVFMPLEFICLKN
jgi:hypothetical protein